MCGIAGIIHRGNSSNVGSEMTSMLMALKHRGPDSTGFAVYGPPILGDYVMRIIVAEKEDMATGHDIKDKIAERIAEVERRIILHGAEIKEQDAATDYALRYVIHTDDDTEDMARHIEEIDSVEILSLGNGLELIKDLGDANEVGDAYGLKDFNGTHAIGHTRMATESGVDIRSAHPYWAYPYSDVSVVHNGQLTNYWNNRRALERKGMRFMSSCDSELIAVYLANKIRDGVDLENALCSSLSDLDGVFTYMVATQDQLGMAKDHMAAKPMVLYESDDLVVCASEEVAIRTILPHEIDTYDPYQGEVKVWQA